MQRHRLLPSLLLIGLTVITSPAGAAGTVQLNLVGDTQGSAMLFQQWGQALGKAGIQNVRLRTGQESDTVGIETLGDPQSPIYVVTGIVRSADELVLPGRVYRRGDLNRLAEWLNDLAKHGPNAAKERNAAFGLFSAQLDEVRQDLSTPVGFATQGASRQEVVRKIARRLKFPLKLDGDTDRALAGDKVGEELIDLSCGTTLAYVLRSAGYCLVPSVNDDGLVYSVIKADASVMAWPVGWPSDKTPRQGLPALFEFLNVNVQNVACRHGPRRDCPASEGTGIDRPRGLGAARNRPGQDDGLAAQESNDLQPRLAKAAVSGGDEVRSALRRGGQTLPVGHFREARMSPDRLCFACGAELAAAEGDRTVFSADVFSRNMISRRKMDHSPTSQRTLTCVGSTSTAATLGDFVAELGRALVLFGRHGVGELFGQGLAHVILGP